jgi:hypothetical protein
MVTKFSTVSLLLLITSATIFSTCKKKFGCDETVYNFEICVKAYPDKDSIHIGDTIWIEANTATIFEDMPSGKMIDYSGAENLGSAIGFGQFLNRDSVIPAAGSFDYFLLKGVSVKNPNTTQIREYLFTEESNSYLFKLAVIPKQLGTYGIGVSNAANVYRKSDKCTKALFVINFCNTKQHFYLNPNITSLNTDTTKPNPSYYFKVY